MTTSELLAELHNLAENVHIAMGTDDGRPEPFRAELDGILQRHGSELDPDQVFRAILSVANRSNPDALTNALTQKEAAPDART